MDSIEVLADMRNQVKANASLSETERNDLYERIANHSIFGIDAGREPPIAKIARINMYLHGDGGSRVYAADALDKQVLTSAEEGEDAKIDLEELRRLLAGNGNTKPVRFDLCITNPPFSMDYSCNLPDELRILRQYALAKYKLEGTSNLRRSLRSSMMFTERYWDLLKPGGALITVIDDSILGGKKYRFARDFIRERFIVRAVISLHGDAFQRVGARAKTSILYLIRRSNGDRSQPDVFMAESEHIGLDDAPSKTPLSKASAARTAAEKETEEIVAEFQKYMAGEKGPWLVPAEAIKDRLDVKSCLPRLYNIESEWKNRGLEVKPLEEIVDPIVDDGINPQESPNEEFTLLRIRYDGIPEAGEKRLGRELTYNYVIKPRVEDIVVSNVNVALGSTAVIPPGLDHCIASSEFTIMRVKDKRFDPFFLWGYLRSSEVRARLLSKSTGIGRHRAKWASLRTIPVPIPDTQKTIGAQYRESIEKLRMAENLREGASRDLDDQLNVENDWALRRLRTAKPPK